MHCIMNKKSFSFHKLVCDKLHKQRNMFFMKEIFIFSMQTFNISAGAGNGILMKVPPFELARLPYSDVYETYLLSRNYYIFLSNDADVEENCMSRAKNFISESCSNKREISICNRKYSK